MGREMKYRLLSVLVDFFSLFIKTSFSSKYRLLFVYDDFDLFHKCNTCFLATFVEFALFLLLFDSETLNILHNQFGRNIQVTFHQQCRVNIKIS